MRVKTFPGLQKDSVVFYTRDGFYYHKNRVMNGGRLSLVCTLRSSCPGRASCESDGSRGKVTTPHTHDGERSFKLQRRLRKAILDRCRTKDPSSYREITEQEGERYSRKVKMANHHNTLRCSMRRARLERYPDIPKTLNELGEVLAKRKHRNLTETQDGKHNVFFGSIGSARKGTRCIIFMSKRQLWRLKKAKTLFADGTWNSRPSKPKSRQVFSISTCTKDKRGLPLAVVLMQTKNEEAYDKLFETLRDLGVKPRVVHTDFEAAQYNSWKKVFGPTVKVDGCLFHYVVRVREKSKKLKLTHLLQTNPRAESIFRSSTALPLLPHHRIVEGLEMLKRRARQYNLQARLQPFFGYMERTWIPRRKVLSVYRSEDRTNNVAETWNKTLTLAVKKKGPNVWLFIDALVRLEERFAQDIYNLKRGKRVNRLRKAKAVANDRVIRQLTASLNARDISLSTFLNSASYRMKNVWNPVYGQR